MREPALCKRLRIPAPGIRLMMLLFFLLASATEGQEAPGTATPKQEDKKQAARRTKKSRPPAPALPVSWAKALPWRCIGPAAMGGRISAVAVYEADPSTWWAATASGGLLKTVNNGITFEHQFDQEASVSIGDVQVAQSDRKIVWVGTGEANPRNSVSWGDGVYKSMDGGKTWKNMGLRKTFQIGRIAIHPTNPDIVYVGALGRLWGTNPERGLFKTTDGGKTWKKIHFLDDKTGVIDVQMHPGDPETLIIATYERQRDGFDTNDPAKKIGPGSGLYKTTDGGETWKKITEGLPNCNLGRIGIDYYRKNPDNVFLVLESERIGKEPENAAYGGLSGQDADAGARLTRVTRSGPADKAGLKTGDIVLSIDGKTVHSYTDLLREIRMHKAGDKVKLEVSRNRKSVVVEVTFTKRPQGRSGRGGARRSRGGRSSRGARSAFATRMGGQRPNLQDQQGDKGHEYGGIYRSEDGGETWKRINTVNPRPMYFSQIRVDPGNDNYLYVLGISLYRSKDGGKTFTSDGGRGVHVDHHALWIDPKDGRHMILGTDGGTYVTYDRMARWDHLNHVAIGQFYHVGVDTRPDYRVYGGLQDNGSWGGPSRVRTGSGPVNEDWIKVSGGDGFVCKVDAEDPDQIYFESQGGSLGRRNLRTGERGRMRPRAPRGIRYRFNWNTPFILSHHNSRIYYTAGNKVFKSVDRGNRLKAISPGITHTRRGSATALDESPLDPDVIYVGTDDGALRGTRDGGHTWVNLFKEEKKEPEEAGDPEAKEPPEPETAARAPRSRRGSFLERMMENDANKDGKIQRSEVSDRMGRFFDRIDQNNDGVIDEAELKSIASSMGGSTRRGGSRRRATTRTPRAAGKPLHTLLPEPRWVSSIAASRFEAGRAYIALDGHRSDDDKPYAFVTEDFGKTWHDLAGNLPPGAGSTRILAEDIENQDLLYLGTEFFAFVSIDRGVTWTKLGSNLPTVAVHGFAQHPTAGEIVAATHGRSLWVLDVTALRQMTPEAMKEPAHLFQPGPATLWRREPTRGGTNRRFVGANPPGGAQIYYALSRKARSVTLKVLDPEGNTVRDLTAGPEAGLHRVLWNLQRSTSRSGQGTTRQPGRMRRGRPVRPGTYRLVLTVDGATHTRNLVVQVDPDYPDGQWLEYQGFEEEEEDPESDREH